MGNRRPWTEKFKAFMADVADRAGVERPRIVVVPKRASGPRMMPSDWYEIDQQAKVAPQCTLCHERALPGMPPLVRGLCGVCRARLDDEPPQAA